MPVQITYDSKTIDLLIDNEALLSNYVHNRNQNRSGSGKIETINRYGIQEMNFAGLFDEDTYDDLVAWWSWARQGGLWGFAFDSDSAANTTLDGAAAAGQKNVPLTSATGFSVGDVCYIQSVGDDAFEIVVVDPTGTDEEYIVDGDGTYIVDADGTFLVSGASGDGITTIDNLKFSYDVESIFRHWDYWPNAISLMSSFNPKREGNYFKHAFQFARLN